VTAKPPIGPAVGEAKFVGIAGSKSVAVGKEEIIVAERVLLDEPGKLMPSVW